MSGSSDYTKALPEGVARKRQLNRVFLLSVMPMPFLAVAGFSGFALQNAADQIRAMDETQITTLIQDGCSKEYLDNYRHMERDTFMPQCLNTAQEEIKNIDAVDALGGRLLLIAGMFGAVAGYGAIGSARAMAREFPRAKRGNTPS